MRPFDLFDMTGRRAIVTGACGLVDRGGIDALVTSVAVDPQGSRRPGASPPAAASGSDRRLYVDHAGERPAYEPLDYARPKAGILGFTRALISDRARRRRRLGRAPISADFDGCDA